MKKIVFLIVCATVLFGCFQTQQYVCPGGEVVNSPEDCPVATPTTAPAVTPSPTPSPTNTPVQTVEVAECTDYRDCVSCVANYPCGWCKNRGECLKGKAGGPDNSACSGADWAWEATACQQAPAPTEPAYAEPTPTPTEQAQECEDHYCTDGTYYFECGYNPATMECECSSVACASGSCDWRGEYCGPETTPSPTPYNEGYATETISSCPYTINETGSYSLSESVDASGDCITIEPSAEGSVLNCNGHSITGSSASSSTGILLNSVSGVTVKNCQVSNFGKGVWLKHADSNQVSDNTISANWRGLELEYSHQNTVRDNSINLNDLGAYVDGSDHNVFSNNMHISNEGSGLKLDDSDYNTVKESTFSNNFAGLCVAYSDNNQVKDNQMTGNENTALSVDFSTGNTVTGNTITQNDWRGVSIGMCSGNSFGDNTVTGNDPDFICGSETNTDLGGNTCYDNSGCGWLGCG